MNKDQKAQETCYEYEQYLYNKLMVYAILFKIKQLKSA